MSRPFGAGRLSGGLTSAGSSAGTMMTMAAISKALRVERRSAIWAIIALGTLVLPFVVNNYLVRVTSSIAMFGVLAIAFNIITGLCGYAAFGNVVFFGLGAYAAGYVLVRGGHILVAMALAVVLAVLLSIVVGWPLLRLRGHYFAIATIGVSEAFREIATNASQLTGGGMGMSFPVIGSIDQLYRGVYFAFAVLFLGSIALSQYLVRSRLGHGWNAIRGDEEGAEAVGINTTALKIAAWGISAALTGIAGAIYGIWVGYIDPGSVFSLGIALNVAAMALLGGLGTVIGPAVGAIVLGIVSEIIWGQFLTLHLAVLGIVIIGTVLFMPRGLVGLWRSWMTL